MTVDLQGHVFTNAGVAVNGATVDVFTVATAADESTSSASATTSTTTDSTGLWTRDNVAEGIYDVRITNGTEFRWLRYEDRVQLDTMETANFKLRNPADTFEYDIVPAAISADRTLTLPLITGSDTLPAIGIAQAWTADQTFNDGVNLTFGTGGDADLDYDGTDVILDTAVVGTGQLHVRTNDSRTNSIDTALTLRSITSGVPAAGIGTALSFEADSDNSGEGNMPVGLVAFAVTDMTNTSEDTEFAIHLRVAGAALEEKYNFRSTAGSGYTGIFTHAASADRTWTLPNASDTLVGKATTDIFTNKTLNASSTGNVITNVGSSEIEIGIITGHSELSAGPAETDEVLISDAGVFKKINAVELLNPENFTAVALPAAADEIFINDDGVGKKITHDDLLFGANGTPSTQAHSDSAAIGTALDAARSDHKHAMPAASSGPSQSSQSALEAETDEDTYPPPDLIKHSPGMAKVWVQWEEIGAHGITGSYNMTSVTDGGAAGDADHLWATDFSGTGWASAGMVENNSFLTLELGTEAVGGVTTISLSHSGNAGDENRNSMAVFGDQ